MAKYLALLADGGHLGRATDKAGPREMNGRGKRQSEGPARDFCSHGQVLEVYFSSKYAYAPYVILQSTLPEILGELCSPC
jgi:hypothetical protein